MTPDMATEYGALVHRKTTGCGDDSPCSRRCLHAHAWRYASVSNACQEGTWRDGVVPQKTLLSFTDIPKSQTLIPLKSQKTERYETAKAVSPPFASTVAPATRRPWACARLSRSIDVAESFDAMQRAHVPLTFLAARAQMVDFS